MWVLEAHGLCKRAYTCGNMHRCFLVPNAQSHTCAYTHTARSTPPSHTHLLCTLQKGVPVASSLRSSMVTPSCRAPAIQRGRNAYRVSLSRPVAGSSWVATLMWWARWAFALGWGEGVGEARGGRVEKEKQQGRAIRKHVCCCPGTLHMFHLPIHPLVTAPCIHPQYNDANTYQCM